MSWLLLRYHTYTMQHELSEQSIGHQPLLNHRSILSFLYFWQKCTRPQKISAILDEKEGKKGKKRKEALWSITAKNTD